MSCLAGSSCESVILVGTLFFFFKQKTAYEVRISDWSSYVCSSDLLTISSATMPTGFAKRGFSLGQQSRAHGIGSYLPENGTPRVGNMTLPSGHLLSARKNCGCLRRMRRFRFSR